ncbi:YcaO-like family protein [Nonomuraea jabiensis]|uniref:Ribosomal protein S12 methylthiotransferase accessory factor n=1 Tax=Nonomuraea jabiensis TaxID=882448 RepID=A0A7W9G8G6_9ACTN|nr:YcaO-like family protein [Nonomuraea jabiensis]MBB5779135.1 ribosomal protein S12 methylthiotransferase accessory factor [Nonomuraea jabiensis]
MPVDEAGRRVSAALTALGLRAELVDAGDGRDPTAWRCRLFGGEGDVSPVACGMGKGRPDEARVGALFEAVEHYLTGPAGFDPTAVRSVPPAALATGPLQGDACALLLTGTPGGRMACMRYHPLGGPALPRTHTEALVPLFLSAPWYVEIGAAPLRELAGDDCDYAHLMRYSCNSGSAVGVTAAEALLHAVNEAIERDALSLLLIRAFLGGDGFRPRLIDPRTLPHGLARAYATAEELTESTVHLLDITSDLDVPTMLAYTAPTSRHPHRRGGGTSLDPAYAVWRALTELVQTTLGESLPHSGAAVRGDLTGLAAHPALLACGRFDLTGALREAHMVPFPRAAAAAGPPGSQLREVTAMLAARGHPAYHRMVRVLPCGVTAVHVIVPDLERFMLIIDGNLVLPGRRGLAAATGRVSESMPPNWQPHQ